MLDSYKKTLVAAKGNASLNRKFLEKLRKRKPRDLDLVTNELHDQAFEHIDCLSCANCCSGTGPLILDKDIDRLAAHFRTKPSTFTTQFLKMDEDGDYVFKAMPCPFLGTDHYCSVYLERPNACREFPHTQQRNILQKLKITYLNTMICPAVAEVVENLKEHYK